MEHNKVPLWRPASRGYLAMRFYDSSTFLARMIPNSPRWLALKKGDDTEALRVLELMYNEDDVTAGKIIFFPDTKCTYVVCYNLDYNRYFLVNMDSWTYCEKHYTMYELLSLFNLHHVKIKNESTNL